MHVVVTGGYVCMYVSVLAPCWRTGQLFGARPDWTCFILPSCLLAIHYVSRYLLTSHISWQVSPSSAAQPVYSWHLCLSSLPGHHCIHAVGRTSGMSSWRDLLDLTYAMSLPLERGSHTEVTDHLSPSTSVLCCHLYLPSPITSYPYFFLQISSRCSLAAVFFCGLL